MVCPKSLFYSFTIVPTIRVHIFAALAVCLIASHTMVLVDQVAASLLLCTLLAVSRRLAGRASSVWSTGGLVWQEIISCAAQIGDREYGTLVVSTGSARSAHSVRPCSI